MSFLCEINVCSLFPSPSHCPTEPISMSAWADSSCRGPPTPPGSVWQPAPPFQCLPALGAAPKAFAASDAARYHSLGRPMPPAVAPLVCVYLRVLRTHFVSLTSTLI